MSYASISFDELRLFENAMCDIYIKLSEIKYLRVLKSGDRVTHDFLNNYQSKGVENFYVTSQDYDIFSRNYQLLLRTKALSESSTWQSRIEVSFKSVAAAHDIASNIGIKQQAIDSVDDVVTSNVELFQKKEKSIFDILNEMMMGRSKKLERSLLTSYLCSSMLSGCGLNNKANLQTLSLASIFMDLSLEDEKLISIVDFSKDKEKLNEKQISLYLTHPERSAQMVTKSKEIPMGVDRYILIHHEKPNGTGFPKKLSANSVTVTEALFIIAVDFGARLYSVWPNAYGLKDILDDFNNTYNVGNYKKPLAVLNELIPEF